MRYETYQQSDKLTFSHIAPASWPITKLKRLISVSSGDFLPPEGEISDGPIPVYGGNGIRGYTDSSNCNGRTLLIGRVGALCGNTNIADGEFWYSEHALRVFPLKPINLDYLAYLFQVIDLNQFANRTAQPLINGRITTDRYAAVPSLQEQEGIAAYLHASCAAIDAAVAAKRGQIESLDGVRKSLLQRLVTQGRKPEAGFVETGNRWLEKIPAGWALTQLKRVAAVHGGLTLGKSYEGEDVIEYPYLRVANVQDGHVDLTDVTTLVVPPAVAAGVMLQADDVLMTEGGDLDKLGRGTVWEGQIEPCLHQNHVFAVRCMRHKLLPRFLAYVTASQYGRDYFEATGKRTTNLAATNATKVGGFYIPLPPLPVQQELVDYLDAEISRLKAIQGLIGKQIDTLTAYRKSLIHECVTGQRRITEADLARVRAHA